MLLILGILVILSALTVGALIAFANGMADDPDDGDAISYWSMYFALAVGVALIVLHIYLRAHGYAVVW